MSTLSCAAVVETLRDLGGGNASPSGMPLLRRVWELLGVGMGEWEGSLLRLGREAEPAASCG